MIINTLSNFNFVIALTIILTIPLFISQKSKRLLPLLLLVYINIYYLHKVENSTIFLYLWTWSSVFLFFISIVTKRKFTSEHQFSKYLLYILADICFLFLSICYIDYIQYFIYLPIIIRGNLVPFNFFSFHEEKKSLKFEFQLTSLNYLMLFIFLSKYNYSKTVLSFLVITTVLLSSFRLIKSNSSTNLITSIFLICLQLCILLPANSYTVFANLSFAYFIVLFFLISILLPDNIPVSTIKHDSCASLDGLKLASIILIFSIGLCPFLFSSTFFLSVFEIISFQSWITLKSNTFTPIIFILITLFCLNLNWSLMFIAKLIVYTPSKNTSKKLNIFFLSLLFPIFIILSNFFLLGNLTFLNNMEHVPLSTINDNLSHYLLYFYSPLVIFSILGLYFQHTCHNLKLIQKPYSLLFNIFSLNLLFEHFNFFTLQKHLTVYSENLHALLKLLPALSNTYLTLFKTFASSINNNFKKLYLLLIKLKTFSIKGKAFSINFYLIIVLFVFSILSFSINMDNPFITTTILCLLTLIFGFILTSINEDPE